MEDKVCPHGLGECEHIQEAEVGQLFKIECVICKSKISLEVYKMREKKWYAIDGQEAVCGYCASMFNEKFSE